MYISSTNYISQGQRIYIKYKLRIFFFFSVVGERQGYRYIALCQKNIYAFIFKIKVQATFS